MKISIKEAWDIAKKTLGNNLKEVSVKANQYGSKELTITWNIMDSEYHTESNEIFYIALQNLKVKVDSRDKKPAEDVVVETGETKEVEEKPKDLEDSIPF